MTFFKHVSLHTMAHSLTKPLKASEAKEESRGIGISNIYFGSVDFPRL
jgi:hypothetical protein